MNIHQLSVTYVVEQDRLLVQASTRSGELLRAWLTRRLVANLHPHLLQLATDVELHNSPLSRSDSATRKMLMDFKKQEALLQSDFETPFGQQALICPAGVAPLLVTTVNATRLDQGALRVEFQEILPNESGQRSFQLTLATELLHGFMHLFDNALTSSDWGLTEPLNPTDAEDAFIHGLENPNPLTYLN